MKCSWLKKRSWVVKLLGHLQHMMKKQLRSMQQARALSILDNHKATWETSQCAATAALTRNERASAVNSLILCTFATVSHLTACGNNNITCLWLVWMDPAHFPAEPTETPQRRQIRPKCTRGALANSSRRLAWRPVPMGPEMSFQFAPGARPFWRIYRPSGRGGEIHATRKCNSLD